MRVEQSKYLEYLEEQIYLKIYNNNIKRKNNNLVTVSKPLSTLYSSPKLFPRYQFKGQPFVIPVHIVTALVLTPRRLPPSRTYIAF